MTAVVTVIAIVSFAHMAAMFSPAYRHLFGFSA